MADTVATAAAQDSEQETRQVPIPVDELDIITVYSYDPVNFAYTGPTIAYESPMDPGDFHLPRCTTRINPGKAVADHVAVFNEKTQKWSSVLDYRGQEWFLDSYQKVVVEDLGDPRKFNPPLYPEPQPLSKDQLLEAARNARDRKIYDGITVNIGTKSEPITVSADTTTDGKANILGMLNAYTEGLKQEGDTTTWYQSTGKVEVTRDQLRLIGISVFGYADRVFDVWQAVNNRINAGEETSVQQILTDYSALSNAF